MRIWTYRAALLAGLPAALALGGPAAAQTAAPSTNAMVNLVRLLVAQKTITKANGDALIAQATSEAQQAQATQTQVAQQAAAAAETQTASNGLTPAPAGTIRVPYVPEVVRAQIRDELKRDVLAQAKAERWAAPGLAIPNWVRDVQLYGDVRVRSQSNFYAANNSNQIPNYQAIVAGGPRDILQQPIPFLDTREDRVNQLRFRARLGAVVNVGSAVKVGVEVATGNDSGPLSTNATLGGGFGKRNIYLNKAFIEAKPVDWATFDIGRFDNPFLSTDLLFDPDLRFDGAAATVDVGHFIRDGLDLKIVGGAFPLDFGDQNFPDTNQDKVKLVQKYLFSGQIEAKFDLPAGITVRTGVAYHDFVNLQGRLSEPCILYLGEAQCSNDNRAPFFVQKGNTLSFQRQIAVNPNLTPGEIQPLPQLVGLTMDYNVLDVVLGLRVPINDRIELTATGDYLRNLAFKRSDACRYGLAGQPINNGGTNGNGNICDPNPALRTSYEGGNQGFQVMLQAGYAHPRNFGEWRVFAGYKYLESDATLDAFTDDDFHLGGTNAKGYIIGGLFGLYHGVNVGARWLSSNEIKGEPLAIDVLQVDLNVAF